MKLGFYLVCVAETRGFIVFRDSIVHSENCMKCVHRASNCSVLNVTDSTEIGFKAVVHSIFEYKLHLEIQPIPRASVCTSGLH
jgi:hypothetical protein